MKVLVCGGAGYIGTQLVREFLRHTEHSVVIADSLEASHGSTAHIDTEDNWRRTAAKTDASPPPGRRFATLEVGDVRDAHFLDGVFARHAPIDAVVHMCAYAVVPESVHDPLKYYDNNVIGMIRILQAMHKHRCNMLILSSTCSLFGSEFATPEEKAAAAARGDICRIPSNAKYDPENPYAETKMVCEMLLKDCARAYGIKSVCLRYFNACGADADGDIGEMHDPETHLIPLVLRVPLATQINAHNALHHPNRTPVQDHVCICGTDYPTRDGTCIRDYIHIKDLSTAHIRALELLTTISADDTGRHFLCYNIGTSRGCSVREVIDAARRVTGHAIPAIEVGRRAGDPPVLVAAGVDSAKALNWTTEYNTIDDIIASAWKFHRTHPVGVEPVSHDTNKL